LRIALTDAEDATIKAKLGHAQMAMEKDMLNLKLIEAIRQISQLKKEL
jgi:hypothetical protein